MAVRSLPKLIAFLLLGPMGGLAFAQEPGDTSGTSARTNVQAGHSKGTHWPLEHG